MKFKKQMETNSFLVECEVSKDKVANLLCSAFEGGSNYWYTIDFDKSKRPNKINLKETPLFPEETKHIHWPLFEGGHLCILDRLDDECEYTLDLKMLAAGLQVMQEQNPKHFADLMNENDDAITADVFLQLVCFGEVRYG